MNAELFKAELSGVIKRKFATLRREGTVGVGRDCLWQLSVTSITRECPNGPDPRGTNSAWVARQTFDEIVSQKPFSKFVYA